MTASSSLGFTADSLQDMKRNRLQQLCKANGIRANQKTVELIAQLSALLESEPAEIPNTDTEMQDSQPEEKTNEIAEVETPTEIAAETDEKSESNAESNEKRESIAGRVLSAVKAVISSPIAYLSPRKKEETMKIEDLQTPPKPLATSLSPSSTQKELSTRLEAAKLACNNKTLSRSMGPMKATGNYSTKTMSSSLSGFGFGSSKSRINTSSGIKAPSATPSGNNSGVTKSAAKSRRKGFVPNFDAMHDEMFSSMASIDGKKSGNREKKKPTPSLSTSKLPTLSKSLSTSTTKNPKTPCNKSEAATKTPASARMVKKMHGGGKAVPVTKVASVKKTAAPAPKKRPTFDLKASLARPLTYKPYTGKYSYTSNSLYPTQTPGNNSKPDADENKAPASRNIARLSTTTRKTVRGNIARPVAKGVKGEEAGNNKKSVKERLAVGRKGGTEKRRERMVKMSKAAKSAKLEAKRGVKAE